MFYLAADSNPTNAQEFTTALQRGIAQAMTLPAGTKVVTLAGDYPQLASVTVDLTGCRVDPNNRLPTPRGTGKTAPAATGKSLRVFGNPIIVDTAKVSLDLAAADAELVYDRDAADQLLLLPGACRDGRLSVEISRADLEALMLSQAKLNAAQQGATITGLELQLTQNGDRSLTANVRVSAKKSIFSGVVRVTGRLDVSDDLTAKISGLDCRGEGMGGTMAAGLIKPKLKGFEGREFPLASFAVSGIHLRDVRIAGIDPLRVTAAFGS